MTDPTRSETGTHPAENRCPLERLFKDNKDICMYSSKVREEPDVPPVGVHLMVGDDDEFLRPIQALDLSRLRIPYNPVRDVVPAETRAIIREAN